MKNPATPTPITNEATNRIFPYDEPPDSASSLPLLARASSLCRCNINQAKWLVSLTIPMVKIYMRNMHN